MDLRLVEDRDISRTHDLPLSTKAMVYAGRLRESGATDEDIMDLVRTIESEAAPKIYYLVQGSNLSSVVERHVRPVLEELVDRNLGETRRYERESRLQPRAPQVANRNTSEEGLGSSDLELQAVLRMLQQCADTVDSTILRLRESKEIMDKQQQDIDLIKEEIRRG